MQPNDRPEFARLVTSVLDYYRQDVTGFTLDVWWQACQGFDLEQVRAALTAHAMDPERGQFPPKAADVVRVLAGTRTDRAAVAWGKAFEAMGAVGAYQDVVFDDPAIHAVVEDLGGWPKVCRTELKELSYLQHRFCESYRAYAVRTFTHPRRLPGDRSPDSEFEKKGLKPPRPVLIGDPTKARQVYEAGGEAGKTAITFNVAWPSLPRPPQASA